MDAGSNRLLLALQDYRAGLEKRKLDLSSQITSHLLKSEAPHQSIAEVSNPSCPELLGGQRVLGADAGMKVWEFVLKAFPEHFCLPNDSQQACARGKVAVNGKRRQIPKSAVVTEGDFVECYRRKVRNQNTKRLASSRSRIIDIHTSTVVQPQIFLAKRSNGARSGHKAPNRASTFVKWLVETYGKAWLMEGCVGVLDVAGGAGKVALELCCRYGIPCTGARSLVLSHVPH